MERTERAQEKKKIMSISFDIDTKIAGHILGDYTGIYHHIERFLENEDFYRQQGSVFFSSIPMSRNDVIAVVNDMYEKYPYMKKCVRDIVMQEVGPRHSLNSLGDYDGTVGEFSVENTVKTAGGPIPKKDVEAYFQYMGMKMPLDLKVQLANEMVKKNHTNKYGKEKIEIAR